MKAIHCIHCGHIRFMKTSTISCSAIPPFFKCSKCKKFQPGKINFALSPMTGWSVRTADGLFVSHLVCRTCEKEVLEFDADSLPSGWIIEVEETVDSLGNPMWINYAYCGDH